MVNALSLMQQGLLFNVKLSTKRVLLQIFNLRKANVSRVKLVTLVKGNLKAPFQ